MTFSEETLKLSVNLAIIVTFKIIQFQDKD